MFVIVHNNSVIKGPNDWNKKRFEEVIREDCEIEVTLDSRNDEHNPVIISDSVKILPTLGLPLPAYNARIQTLNGPFWNFSDTVAEMYYEPVDMSVDAVKVFLMDKITNTRYTKEVGGIKQTVQETEVTVDTMRGSRDIFMQAYLSIGDTETINWKFPEAWLPLNKSELGQLVAAGRAHIQSCFDWENTWASQVNSAATLEELNILYGMLEAELQT